MNILIVSVILALSISLSYLSNFLVLSFAQNLGIRNKNNISVRWSNESKPSLGGVSLYFVFLFTGLIVAIAFIEYIQLHQIEYLGLFTAASIAFFMGLADDAYDTKPYLKLLIQILCGLILSFTNHMCTVFSNDIFNHVFTIIWVVTLMNSLNMLDNMDGITATTCCCVLIACLFIFIGLSGWSFTIWTILLLTTVGTLVGFLFFNVHPSKMFMGDGGSQFIGVIIAFFTGKFLFVAEMMTDFINWKGLLLAVISLTPAAVDTLTVVINRLKRGQSPMVGGKDHTTHHLVYSGLSDRQVWYVFLAVGLVSIIVCISVFALLKNHMVLGLSVGCLWLFAVFFALYRNTIIYPAKAN